MQLIAAEPKTQVEQLWTDFQKELEMLGIEAIEKRMTERYLENLKRYQDAGYYTNMG